MFKTIDELDKYLEEHWTDKDDDPKTWSPKEKLMAVYNNEIGSALNCNLYEAIEFWDNYEGNILTKDEIRAIQKRIDKLRSCIDVPFIIDDMNT